MTVRATMEDCDSRPAEHLDATSAPRSLHGEEDSANANAPTPRQSLQQRRTATVHYCPSNRRGARKPSTRMLRTSRPKRGGQRIERRTSAWDCSFEIRAPPQARADCASSTWYADDNLALYSRSSKQALRACFQAAYGLPKVPRQTNKKPRYER